MYIGATNNVYRDPACNPSLSDLAFLIDCTTRQIDHRLQASQVTNILLGNRPVSIDTFPLLGETSIDGIWLATGTNRDGFLLSPLIATRLVDAMEAGCRHLADAAIFVPERPPLPSSRNVDDAMEEAVENYIAIAFERGAVLPQVGHWEDEFRGEMARRVAALYSRLKSRFILPPDISWDIERGGLISMFEDYYAHAEGIWA